jgi:hypothetical protein
MADPLIRVPYLLEPSVTSVSLLVSKLGPAFVSGSVTSKAYDHGSRVVRQQRALLAVHASEARALEAPGDLVASRVRQSVR